MKPYTYLLIDLGAVLVPFIFSFHPRLRFSKNFLPFFLANAIVAAFFIVWDYYFTHLGIWGFNDDYLIGVKLGLLPLEEILFFIFIPFSCTFSFHCFRVLKINFFSKKIARLVSVFLAPSLLIMGSIFYSKAYTAFAFLGCGLFIMLAFVVQRKPWAGLLLSTYTVMLLPFFIVNGLLTGTGLEKPVVWYNDKENLAIRLLTIPVEDIFYGFLLVGGTIYIYEFLLAKKRKLYAV